MPALDRELLKGLAMLGVVALAALLAMGALDARLGAVKDAATGGAGLAWLAAVAIMGLGAFIVYRGAHAKSGMLLGSGALFMLGGLSVLGATVGLPAELEPLAGTFTLFIRLVNAIVGGIAWAFESLGGA